MTHTDYWNPVQVYRAYKFLLRPTCKQAAALAACLEDHRQLYNAALEERREAWAMGHISATYYTQAKQLPDIRRDDASGQGRWSSSSQQQTLRRLNFVMNAFFQRIRLGEKPGYPRFKGRGWFNSVTWPTDGDGCRWNATPHDRSVRAYFKSIGHVRVHQHRPVRGRVKTVTVKREGCRWYVILSCDGVPIRPLPATGAVVGIDLGIASFLTTSDGTQIPNPRPMAAAADRLAATQQAFRRRTPGSRGRRKAGDRVAALHGKIRRSRLDHAHKTALALIRSHDVIVHEDLKVANMTRRPAPRPVGDGTYEPNQATGKAGLNRSIQDAGWRCFLRILAAKAESAGRTIIAVNPYHTSQRCAKCGHTAAGNRVTQAAFQCLACGHAAHADINAAVNILRAGLARQAAQAA